MGLYKLQRSIMLVNHGGYNVNHYGELRCENEAHHGTSRTSEHKQRMTPRNKAAYAPEAST
jgi:hypothetical protein